MIHSTLVTPDLKARFVGEIKLLGRLNHPGIVKIFDAGVQEQADVPAIPFFAMELVDGKPLGHMGRLAPRPAQRALASDGGGLRSRSKRARAPHRSRDLKPSNILVRADGRR
jgi:serine/threonine protein kinase